LSGPESASQLSSPSMWTSWAKATEIFILCSKQSTDSSCLLVRD
jgi:hypothetical protein